MRDSRPQTTARQGTTGPALGRVLPTRRLSTRFPAAADLRARHCLMTGGRHRPVHSECPASDAPVVQEPHKSRALPARSRGASARALRWMRPSTRRLHHSIRPFSGSGLRKRRAESALRPRAKERGLITPGGRVPRRQSSLLCGPLDSIQPRKSRSPPFPVGCLVRSYRRGPGHGSVR